MFIVDPFINSTGLAIVAEADLRCGEFLSEKSCRHKLVVFTSFWSWLLKVSSVFTSMKNTATPFWLLMHYGSADCPWEFWVLFLIFMFLKYVFFVFILDAIFCGTSFSIYQDSVWLVKKS